MTPHEFEREPSGLCLSLSLTKSEVLLYMAIWIIVVSLGFVIPCTFYFPEFLPISRKQRFSCKAISWYLFLYFYFHLNFLIPKSTWKCHIILRYSLRLKVFLKRYKFGLHEKAILVVAKNKPHVYLIFMKIDPSKDLYDYKKDKLGMIFLVIFSGWAVEYRIL